MAVGVECMTHVCVCTGREHRYSISGVSECDEHECDEHFTLCWVSGVVWLSQPAVSREPSVQVWGSKCHAFVIKLYIVH